MLVIPWEIEENDSQILWGGVVELRPGLHSIVRSFGVRAGFGAVCVLLLGSAAVPPLARAAVLTVSTTVDLPGTVCGSPCSLRQAVNAANAAGGVNTISFAVDGPFALTTGVELFVDGSQSQTLTITGNGRTHTIIAGEGVTRLLEVGAGATVNVSGVTLRDGNAGAGDGGAILNIGTLAVDDSTITSNVAGVRGGGIRNAPRSSLVVTETLISGNSAGVVGGGIANGGDSRLDVSHSVISGNSAAGAGGGGGIANQGQATVLETTIAGNTAVDPGGGIAIGASLNSVPGLLTLRDSVISNNTVTGSGSGKDGGGIANYSSLVVEHSSVLANRAGYDGGGIANEFGAIATVTDSSITGNVSRHDGGGITNEFKGTPTNSVTLTRSQITTNTAGHLGGGIFNAFGTVILDTSVVTNNVPGNCRPTGGVPGCVG